MADLDPDDLYGDEDDKSSETEENESQPWLDLITTFDKAGYRDWQDRADNIDKLYANSDKLASVARDREFQIFWANIQVINPSIYSRPPQPVVVPRFRDRRPLYRATSELLERATTVAFELEDIDGLMRAVRDDVSVLSRGVAWVRYEAKGGPDKNITEKACLDYVSRRDFAHDPARVWKEVDWVAKRSWLTKRQMKQRFEKSSKDAYKNAAYEIRKDKSTGETDGKSTAGVWELWCRSANLVVWVTEGVDVCLDSGEPHLNLEGFFPCPRPAYGTVERGSLLPVPDWLYYKDQIEEINSLTNRISALAEALRLKGFYPAGAGEIGDAIEAAVKNVSDRSILIGVSNWAMIGSGGVKDMIVWLPIDVIAKTVAELVQLRKQLIDDVYQITGLSDIMRGSTEPSETLGAQELKSQYGSTRIRDKQDELVRFARDLVRIVAEIMAEDFQKQTLLDMSQLQIATNADIAKQVKAMEQQQAKIGQQIEAAQSNPQLKAAAQQHPEEAQKLMQDAQAQMQKLGEQIAKLKDTPTIEQVMGLLKDQRTRPFILDIETDSTIAPDENATKQRATEFVTAVGGYMGQALPLVQAVPQAAPLVAETLKYVAGQFRAGRSLEGVIDEFAEQMKQSASQPKGPSPEQQQAQAEIQAGQERLKADLTKMQQEAKLKTDEAAQKQQTTMASEERAQQEHAGKAALAKDEHAATLKSMEAKRAEEAQQHQQEMQKGALELKLLLAKIRQAAVQTRATVVGAHVDAKAKLAKASADGEGQADQASEPQGEPGEAPDMDMSFETEFEQKSTAAFMQITETLKTVADTLAAPVEIIKDAQGNAVGVKRGGVVKQVTRDPNTGEVVGLN